MEFTMNLVWQIPSDFLDFDWIREVLEQTDTNEHFDGRFDLMVDNSIVVVSSVFGYERVSSYVEKLEKRGLKYVLVHLSDQFHSDDWSHYPSQRLVLRTHWDRKYGHLDNVLVIPLGYTTGFRKASEQVVRNDILDRKYLISFAGDTSKASRHGLNELVSRFDSSFLHETSRWNDPAALEKEEYKAVMFDSKFVFCPRGFWSVDTFRLYEALECGAIPVVETSSPIDYFEDLFGPYPFLSYVRPEQAVSQVNALLSRDDELVRTQERCREWWSARKEDYKRRIANRIHAAMSTAPSAASILRRKLIYEYVMLGSRARGLGETARRGIRALLGSLSG